MTKFTAAAKCCLCAETFKGAGISTHLKKHLEVISKVPVIKQKKTMLHIKVSSGPAYFLHLLMPANLLFGKFDTFLRGIWLECCGHMSEFMIDREKISMKKQLGNVLTVGETIHYLYDFGTTTELDIKLVNSYEMELKPDYAKEITILAQNEPYTFKCVSCGKVATQICSQCQYEIDNPFYCDECAEDEEKHACGESEMCLSVSNSPRMGLCAYEGEDRKFKLVNLS